MCLRAGAANRCVWVIDFLYMSTGTNHGLHERSSGCITSISYKRHVPILEGLYGIFTRKSCRRGERPYTTSLTSTLVMSMVSLCLNFPLHSALPRTTCRRQNNNNTCVRTKLSETNIRPSVGKHQKSGMVSQFYNVNVAAWEHV